MRLLALLLLLASAATHGVDVTPDAEPVVLVPELLRAAVAPWSLAAYSLPPGATVVVALRNVASGELVATGQQAAGPEGHASPSLVPSDVAALAPGAHVLEASVGNWSSSVNVTLLVSAPFLVRAPRAAACRASKPHSCFADSAAG